MRKANLSVAVMGCLLAGHAHAAGLLDDIPSASLWVEPPAQMSVDGAVLDGRVATFKRDGERLTFQFDDVEDGSAIDAELYSCDLSELTLKDGFYTGLYGCAGEWLDDNLEGRFQLRLIDKEADRQAAMIIELEFTTLYLQQVRS